MHTVQKSKQYEKVHVVKTGLQSYHLLPQAPHPFGRDYWFLCISFPSSFVNIGTHCFCILLFYLTDGVYMTSLLLSFNLTTYPGKCPYQYTGGFLFCSLNCFIIFHCDGETGFILTVLYQWAPSQYFKHKPYTYKLAYKQGCISHQGSYL